MSAHAVERRMEIQEVFPNKEHMVLVTVGLPDVGPGGEYILDPAGEWKIFLRPVNATLPLTSPTIT